MKHTSSHVFLQALCALFSLLFFFNVQTSQAQPAGAITFTLLKQPCNNDGILVAHTTGLTPPFALQWRTGNQVFTHTINTVDDTLYNYGGGYAYVYSSGSLTQAYGTYAGSPPFTFTDTVTHAHCPVPGGVKVTVSGGKSPYSFEWLNTSGTVIATGNPVQLPAGRYGLLITDDSGCVAGTYGDNGTSGGSPNYAGIFIENITSVKDSIATTPAACTNGTATVTSVSGGVAPYTYLWSNGANTPSITGLAAGTYQVTVTDAQGCYRENYVYLTQTPTITVNATVSNATCLQNDGSIIAFGSGGATPYSYSWNNGQQTQIAGGLTAGSYTVTVTDANNCTGTKFSSVTAATPVTVTYSTTPSSCTSASGSATLNITGGKAPYTVAWGTYPAQSGTTASGLLQGSYNFVVTDSVGCVRTGIVSVPPVSIITANILKADATCTQSNGNASVVISTGTPGYTYLWSNASTGSSISGLTAGAYTVTITDRLNCTLTKTAIVKAATPITLTLLPTQASCIFAADGSIAANLTGGTAPYTYNWSNGQTTATATGLLANYYSVFVRDANGCVQSNWTNLGYNASNNSCYCTITGRVYVDTNTNCILDAGEKGVQNIAVHASGLGYAFTNSSGVYSFKAPTGNYNLSENVQAYYPLSPCQSNSIPINVTARGGCIVTQNFANVVNPIRDVKITTISYNSPPVIGYDYFQRIIVENNGTVREDSIQLRYKHDGQLMLVGVAPSLFTLMDGSNPDWYGITGGFPSLEPGAKQVFNLEYAVPPNIPMNTEVVFHDTTTCQSPIVMNWLTDYSPWNNVNEHVTHAVGSFDPNDKQVSPLGDGPMGFIGVEDSIITYTIRFQNTGNYPARKVVVIDTLDGDLDFTTLAPAYSSHNYVADMSENGIVKFTFNNINLPDSLSQPLASIGVVQYEVKQKPSLQGGTRIASPASIYFDFNAPVQTNLVVNTINIATGIREPKINPFEFNLYPNPSNGRVNLAIQSKVSAKATLSFYNMMGQVMQSQAFQMEKGDNLIQANTNSLMPGIYLAVVTDGHYSHTQKVTIIE